MGLAQNCVRGVLLLGGILVLSGCGGDDAASDAAHVRFPCLPQMSETQAKPAASNDVPSHVDVYFDGSGSIAGYLKAAAEALHVIPDVLALLPAAAGRRGDALRYHKFGRAIHDLPIDSASSLADPASYSCRGHRTGCDNDESRIDGVLRAAEHGSPNDLTVVVTDFWLKDSDLSASGELGIGIPLANLFAKGRSIDIVGIRAPYSGPIYDLPGGLAFPAARERALFILLIGPADLVRYYSDAFFHSGSPAFAAARVHESLFSASPFTAERIDGDWQHTRRSQAVTVQRVLPASLAAGVGQFVISRSGVESEPDTTIGTTVDLSGTLLRNAVWSGPTKLSTTIWMLGENGQEQLSAGRCSRETWTRFADLKGALTQGSVSGQFDFVMKPQSQLSILASGQTYAVVGEIDQTGIETPNPADKWMRDWSFDISTAQSVVRSKPAFFPTFNLAQTASILEYELNRSLSRGRVVAKSAVSLRIED